MCAWMEFCSKEEEEEKKQFIYHLKRTFVFSKNKQTQNKTE